VERTLDVLAPLGVTLVYDPFVGCGTTAVVAASHGYRTVSADLSPLAALTTWMKLHVPSARTLARIEREHCRSLLDGATIAGVRDVLGSVARRDKLTLLFVLAAAWMRTAAKSHRRPSLARELELLLAEMRERPPGPSPHRRHAVRAAGFDAPSTVATFNERTAMITSPPFPGSTRSGLRERVDGLLVELGCAHLDAADVDQRAHGAAQVPYETFIDSLVMHAEEQRCCGVAIEMSSGVSPAGSRYDEYLSHRLSAFGFEPMGRWVDPAAPEPLSIVCARRQEWCQG
jgi:hypothetical protein